MLRIMPALVLLLLLAACFQSNAVPEATLDAGATEGWNAVEAPGWSSQPGFALKLPRAGN